MIDITNLTSLITAFRQETEQGSISPETLGALLQSIADELANASSDQETIVLEKLQENFKSLGSFFVSLAQGDDDRNNVLADIALYNPITGMLSAQRGTTFIKQATTERAGAMRAQQVIDLNAAKKNISTLQTDLENLSAVAVTQEIQPFSNSDSFGEISGVCIRNGLLCTVIGKAFIQTGESSISVVLPYAAVDDFLPEVCIYYDDTMQWVRVYLYNDLNGAHIAATIPEDFMNGGEALINFSLSFIIKS